MDDNGGDGDGRHEDARAPILAGVDTSPVLKPSEHILDIVTAAVEQDVMRDQHCQVGACGTEQVGVATPISGQRFGLWKGIDHERSTIMYAHFPLDQDRKRHRLNSRHSYAVGMPYTAG